MQVASLALSRHLLSIPFTSKKEWQMANDYAPLCPSRQECNDGIHSDDFSLHYSSADVVAIL